MRLGKIPRPSFLLGSGIWKNFELRLYIGSETGNPRPSMNSYFFAIPVIKVLGLNCGIRFLAVPVPGPDYGIRFRAVLVLGPNRGIRFLLVPVLEPKNTG